MDAENTIFDAIDSKRLTWYGQLQLMHSNKWPMVVINWILYKRWKRQGSPRRCMQDVEESMRDRER